MRRLIMGHIQSGIKRNSTASKMPYSIHFHAYKNKVIIRIIVYIFITFTSFESWTMYVIYIVILIEYSLCKLERQRIKFCAKHFRQFLSDVNTDVNGNLLFLNFSLNRNCCIWEGGYPIFTKGMYFGHASFTFPIITVHQYFLYDVTQY